MELNLDGTRHHHQHSSCCSVTKQCCCCTLLAGVTRPELLLLVPRQLRLGQLGQMMQMSMVVLLSTLCQSYTQYSIICHAAAAAQASDLVCAVVEHDQQAGRDQITSIAFTLATAVCYCTVMRCTAMDGRHLANRTGWQRLCEVAHCSLLCCS